MEGKKIDPTIEVHAIKDECDAMGNLCHHHYIVRFPVSRLPYAVAASQKLACNPSLAFTMTDAHALSMQATDAVFEAIYSMLQGGA